MRSFGSAHLIRFNMKKLVYLLGLVILASCGGSEDYTDWANPISHEQEAGKTVSFTATAETSTINFANVTTDSVKLFTPTVNSEDAIASQTMTITLYNADKTASYVLYPNANGYVSTSELQKAVEKLYGKGGDLRNIPATIKNTTVLTRGEAFTNTVNVTIKAQLIAPKFPEFIYQVGNNNGWGDAGVNKMRSPEMDGKYLGYCYLDGELKFRSHETTWDAPDWGMGSAEGSLVEEDEKNIPVGTAGFYRIEASLADGTYSYSPIMIGVIGSATPNGWESDVNMTYDKAEKAWTWTGNLVAGELKFRANDDWAISWGGANDDAYNFNNLTEFNGKNLKIEEAGNYTIKLYLTYEGNHKVVLTKN